MTAPTPKTWDNGFFVDNGGRTLRGYCTEGDPTGRIEWISDGWACIDEILESHKKDGVDRHFVIQGKSVHGKPFTFTMKATAASDGRKLKAALVNEFGIDSTGQLNLNVIQRLSNSPSYIKLFNHPQWLDGQLMAPGLISEAVRFDLERKIAVDFQDDTGYVDVGVKTLRLLLEAFDPGNVAIMIAVILGAPVIAKLWPDERFALLLTGLTGSKKTTVSMLMNSIYGPGYNSESTLIRWGDGATTNAIEHMAAMTGPFPFIIDNFKIYNEKDIPRFQRLIHAVLEGGEKDRLTKDSNGLRQAEDYLCLPIVNGENYPGHDSATRARIIQLNWTEPVDIDKLTEAQKHVTDLNALGKAWCLWLSSDEGKAAMDIWSTMRFDAARSRYLRTTAKDSINTGRIATNAGIIALVWDLLDAWPVMSDLANEYREILKAAIKDHIVQSQYDVTEDLDAEKFVSWLKSEIEVGRYRFENAPVTLYYRDHFTETIGRYRTNQDTAPPKAEALITPEIFGSKLLPAWQKQVTGVRADKKALLRQLVKRGYLFYNEKESIFTHVRKIDGKNKRVLVFNWSATTNLPEDATCTHVAEKQEA
jgi:hypothetical protein